MSKDELVNVYVILRRMHDFVVFYAEDGAWTPSYYSAKWYISKDVAKEALTSILRMTILPEDVEVAKTLATEDQVRRRDLS